MAVAVVDGQLVGTADLLVDPNLTHRCEPWAIVENVIVASTARRTGVGRALMEHLIELPHGGLLQLNRCPASTVRRARVLRSMGLEAVAEGFKIYFDE